MFEMLADYSALVVMRMFEMLAGSLALLVMKTL
jgi:hypothetical protein